MPCGPVSTRLSCCAVPRARLHRRRLGDALAVGGADHVRRGAGHPPADPGMAVNIEHEDTELGTLEGLRLAAANLIAAAGKADI